MGNPKSSLKVLAHLCRGNPFRESPHARQKHYVLVISSYRFAMHEKCKTFPCFQTFLSEVFWQWRAFKYRLRNNLIKWFLCSVKTFFQIFNLSLSDIFRPIMSILVMGNVSKFLHNKTENITHIGNKSGFIPPEFTSFQFVIFAIIFILIALIGLVGNTLVIFIICREKKLRASLMNIILLHLAVADTVNLISCMPDIVSLFIGSWNLGLFMCRLLRFAEIAALYSSLAMQVAVCIERYVYILSYFFRRWDCRGAASSAAMDFLFSTRVEHMPEEKYM